ncbi:hypothetical protein BMS3Abin04_01494 [bacterium BMS3Abin04]|nr:hypothetical protein BMS3Abin04_01494 [bacterium BMS3Abin04]
MKYLVRISYVLIIFFILVNFSYAQQYSASSLLSPNQIVQTTYSYGGSATYSSSGYNYGFSSIEFSGDNPYIEYHEIVTFYKFSLSFLPSDAYNIHAKVEVYRTSGSGNSKFVLASDIAHPNNDEDKFYAVTLGSELFDVDLYSGTWHDVTSYVTPRISQGFINFGVKRSETYIGQVFASILVEWDAPSHITAKNNFENGTIKIGVNKAAENKNSPYPFTANVGQTVNLQAVAQSYGNYNWIWNDTEAPLNKSKWYKTKNG